MEKKCFVHSDVDADGELTIKGVDVSITLRLCLKCIDNYSNANRPSLPQGSSVRWSNEFRGDLK